MTKKKLKKKKSVWRLLFIYFTMFSCVCNTKVMWVCDIQIVQKILGKILLASMWFLTAAFYRRKLVPESLQCVSANRVRFYFFIWDVFG